MKKTAMLNMSLFKMIIVAVLLITLTEVAVSSAAFQHPPVLFLPGGGTGTRQSTHTHTGATTRTRTINTSPTPVRVVTPTPLLVHVSIAEEVHQHQIPPPPSIVERCYAAWNRRDMSDAAACFADEFTYDEGQYLGCITNKAELELRFKLGAEVLPPKYVVVMDNIAVCPTTGNIGTRWHAEREDGAVVPFTKGCSFYTVDSDSGLIKTGFKVSEMIIKPSKNVANGLVSSASKLMNTSETLRPSMGAPSSWSSEVAMTKMDEELNKDSSAAAAAVASSIIETYFAAWNKRDMEAALDCFVDDCIYEVEDPVFVDTFRGKMALREHLVKNAAALPSACQIMLDDLAIDAMNGTFGVRWHLEVNGVAIPNLCGCSMYTMDREIGLLKSGFDVTEAPVKLPGGAVQKMFRVIPSNVLQSLLGVLPKG